MVSVGMLLIKKLIGRKKTCKLCEACINGNIQVLYFPIKRNTRNAWIADVIGQDSYDLISDRLQGDSVYIQKTFLSRSRWVKIRKDFKKGATLQELCEKYNQTIDSIRKIVSVTSVNFDAVNAVRNRYVKEYSPGTTLVRYTPNGKVHHYLAETVSGKKAEQCTKYCALYRDFGASACSFVRCKAYDRKDFRTIIFKNKKEIK